VALLFRQLFMPPMYKQSAVIRAFVALLPILLRVAIQLTLYATNARLNRRAGTNIFLSICVSVALLFRQLFMPSMYKQSAVILTFVALIPPIIPPNPFFGHQSVFFFAW